MKSLRQPQDRNLTEIISSYIARDFYLLEVDSNVPTIEDYVKLFSVSRGTVQNAIGNIKKAKGAVISGKGVSGSYLREKNPEILLSLSGWEHFIGCCGIPQTQPIIATTSALYLSSKEEMTMSYVQGSQRRIRNLLAGKLDFIIASKMAALELINEYEQSLTIALELGDQSYLTGYNLLVRKGIEMKNIKKVGLDPKSPDYKIVTRRFFPESKYKKVHMHYSSLPTAIRNKDIDACIFNRDIKKIMSQRIDFEKWGIDIKELDFTDMEMKQMTNAVILCAIDDYRMEDFIRNNFDLKEIIDYRKEVLNKIILPIL